MQSENFIYYDPDGDIIEIYWDNEPCYGQWYKEGFTLMIGQETQKIVGIVIENVKNIKIR